MRKFDKAITKIMEAEASSQDKLGQHAAGIASSLDAMIKMDTQLIPDGSNYESIQNLYINQLIVKIKDALKAKATETKNPKPVV